MSEPNVASDVLRVAPESVETLAQAAARHDGVAAIGEQSLLRLRNPTSPTRHATVHASQSDARLEHAAEQALAGYAQLDLSDGTVELVVHPQSRRAGVGSELLRLLNIETADAPQGSSGARHRLRPWAHGNLPAAQAFADHHGLRPIRELHRMEMTPPRSGTDADASVHTSVNLPDGVRGFVPGRDEAAVLAVNAAAFASHPEQGKWTRADFDERAAQPWFRADGILLDDAPQGGSDAPTLRGFVWTKITASGDGSIGEIYALGVSPETQGQGVGTRLTSAAIYYLLAQRVRHIELYVDGDNDAAIRTYQRAGFHIANTDVQFEAP